MTNQEEVLPLTHLGEQLAAASLEHSAGALGVAHNALVEAGTALYERRPDWVNMLIDESYDDEHHWPRHFSLMGANGAERGYDFGPHTSIALADALRTELGRPLLVLDVGTGTGMPVYHHQGEGDIAQGISAFDFRRINARHPFKDDDTTYIVANAETLDTIENLAAGYDLVMSRRTMHHLVDTLGTVERLANRTAPGGLLCLDEMSFTDSDAECEVTAAHVLAAMRAGGFEPLETTPIDEQTLALPWLPAVVWRRRADATTPVRFPAAYALDGKGRLTYQLAA